MSPQPNATGASSRATTERDAGSLARGAAGAELVGTYHRFGEIGPVYEVVGLEDDGFATICMVESGETARYPLAEIRQDPVA